MGTFQMQVSKRESHIRVLSLFCYTDTDFFLMISMDASFSFPSFSLAFHQQNRLYPANSNSSITKIEPTQTGTNIMIIIPIPVQKKIRPHIRFIQVPFPESSLAYFDTVYAL